MIYLVIPLLLLIYFELAGQLILKKLNYPIFRYNSPIGFIFFLAVLYLLLPVFIYFHLPTVILFVICTLMFIVLTIFIIMNIREFRFNFNYTIAPVIVFVVVEMYKFYNSGLGSRLYDTSYYLTWVSSIIEYPGLNQFAIKFGPLYESQSIGPGDMYLSYYHFCAYIVWAGKQVFSNLLNLSFDYMPAYIWTMSLMFINFWITSVFNFIEKLKINSKLVIILAYVFIGFYIGNLYWNNAFAFYGNTYRRYILAYVIYFLFEFFRDNKDSSIFLLVIATLALNSTGTSAEYFSALIAYGYLFTQYKSDNKAIRNTVMILFLPLTALSLASFDGKFNLIVAIIIFMMILAFIFNDRILNFFRKHDLLRILLYLIPIGMIITSQHIYGFTDNYNKFFNFISGKQDMTWEFFKFYNWQYVVVNLFVYTLFINYLFRNRTGKLTRFLLIILLTFLNPLSGALIAERITPYLRAFDILLNPFTYVLYICVLYQTIRKYRYLSVSIMLVLTAAFSIIGYDFYTSYATVDFIPDEDYNHIYKMDNDELDAIRYVEGIIKDNDLTDVKVICHSEYIRVFCPEAYNIYNRHYIYITEGDDRELYEIFYINRSFDERKDDDLYNYDNAYNLLVEKGYDFVICDKSYDLYSVEGEYYYPRWQILDYNIPFVYENDKYMVFWTYLDKH